MARCQRTMLLRHWCGLLNRLTAYAIVLMVVVWAAFVVGAGIYDAFYACQGPCSIWQDVIRKSPNKPRGYVNLGQQYLRKGDPVRAAIYYERALEVAKTRPEWERREVVLASGASLGWIYRQLGRHDEASTILVKTWNQYPGTPAVALNLSAIALFYGHLARRDFLDTRNPRGLTEMVFQAEQALTVLTAGIAAVEARQYRFEETHDLYWNRGEAFRLLGRCHEARQSYAIAISLWPDVGPPPPCPIPE